MYQCCKPSIKSVFSYFFWRFWQKNFPFWFFIDCLLLEATKTAICGTMHQTNRHKCTSLQPAINNFGYSSKQPHGCYVNLSIMVVQAWYLRQPPMPGREPSHRYSLGLIKLFRLSLCKCQLLSVSSIPRYGKNFLVMVKGLWLVDNVVPWHKFFHHSR